MIDLISVENMRDSDKATIGAGTPGIVLMERAAYGIFLASDRWTGARKIVIVTGSGNNGGDGFALATVLKEHNISSQILTLSDKTTEDSGFYKDKCIKEDIKMEPFDESTLTGADIIVDCILGTGFAGTPRDNCRDAINAINRARDNGAYVVCADINSGMNGNTGEYEYAVTSDLTVTIGYLKYGLITENAQKIIGNIKVADIGIDLARKEDSIDEDLYGIEVIRSLCR